VSIACVVAGLAVAGCGNDDADPASSPNPGPAFYLTASSAADLRHQAYDAAARFARKQGEGHGLLMLDFGAARRKGGTWGVSLRSGTFFSNDEIRSALQAATRGYEDAHRNGDVTIVYVTTNANIGDPGRGYRPFDKETAREAGEQQAAAIKGLDLPDDVSVALGGDIEPGFDQVGSPEVSIELVSGAVDASGGTYYNVGTAPCKGDSCVNNWTPRHICDVSNGGGRQALPEVYVADQAAGWNEVQDECGIDTFAGASASPVGDLSPKQSWRRLREGTGAGVGAPVAVWPG
jgi:hypothetical protein